MHKVDFSFFGIILYKKILMYHPDLLLSYQLPEYDLQQGFLEEIAKDIVKGTFGWKNG